MKLRIADSSLRLRLSADEVAAVGRGERTIATAHFPDGGALTYALAVSSGTDLTAHFAAGAIEVLVPQGLAEAWAGGDDVGIAATQSTAQGTLNILIEKDFPCVHSSRPLEHP